MKKSLPRLFSLMVVLGLLLTSCYHNSKLISYDQAERAANKVWSYSQRHPDGFTVSVATMTEPTEGIAVAYAATQGCHSRETLNYVVTHAMTHSGFVGGWLDTTDSLYYFDSSRIFPEDSLEAAKKFGIENGQKAIYIISEGTEIRLDEQELDTITK